MDGGEQYELVCEFVVLGKAASRGSKRPVRNKHTGRICLIDGKNSYKYMDLIRKAATAAMQGRPPVDGPVKLEWVAMFPRPKSHYCARGLKATAPKFYLQTPDCSKIVRGVEDSLTGIVYHDDKQIVGYGPAMHKVWTEGEACTRIAVWRFPSASDSPKI